MVTHLKEKSYILVNSNSFDESVSYFSFCVLFFFCLYVECICLPLLDEWLHTVNRPVDHSVRRGRIHPQVSPCILGCFLKDEQQQQRLWLLPHSSTNLFVCGEIRIGELREVMDDILHKQCDYDPASGESFDFDRFEQ